MNAPASGPSRPLTTRPKPPLPPAGQRLPEPPPFRSHPLSPPGACVNCSTPLQVRYATPRCWECGRFLCPDCYWRHGLTPTQHRCASCIARGSEGRPATAISGGLRPAAAVSEPSSDATL
ncbi:MAG TPA: hypothetical protein VEH57_06055 [Thermoplasmata archaeon]|nr:hypothetical protein [Thermoplasmata archaeon]